MIAPKSHNLTSFLDHAVKGMDRYFNLGAKLTSEQAVKADIEFDIEEDVHPNLMPLYDVFLKLVRLGGGEEEK
jgi:hypothetical protein